MAISGDTGEWPLMIEDRCLRLTPSASAASVIVTCSGLMYISSRIAPGCDGLCMLPAALVIVAIVHLHRVCGIKSENHSKVLVHPNSIASCWLALQRVKPQ